MHVSAFKVTLSNAGGKNQTCPMISADFHSGNGSWSRVEGFRVVALLRVRLKHKVHEFCDLMRFGIGRFGLACVAQG